MSIHLKNQSNESFELKYLIRNTHSAQQWANSVFNASTISESDRFYNFPNQSERSLETLIDSLGVKTSYLKFLHPQLLFPKLDKNNLQKSLNDLHFNFAHSHQTTRLINNENSSHWRDFNVLIHAIESALKNSDSVKSVDLPSARIVFTWNDSQPLEITEHDYKDFCINYEFGVAYANYSQVGRQFLEMFRAQDDSLADEHIQPARKISADTYLWFGATAGHFYEKTIRLQMESWFEARKERFNRLGFFWGDPRLSIGYIPVARLADPLYTTSEINAFINHLAKFNCVKAVQIS